MGVGRCVCVGRGGWVENILAVVRLVGFNTDGWWAGDRELASAG